MTDKSRLRSLTLDGNEGMEKNATTILGYIGTTIRIHSFISSQLKVRQGADDSKGATQWLAARVVGI